MAGLMCGCGGKCTRQVAFDLSVVPDDSATLFICGQEVASAAPFDARVDTVYTGPCDDLLVKVENVASLGFNLAGLAVLIQIAGNDFGTAATAAGVTPLTVIGAMSPPAGFELNPPGFDFSSFTPTIPEDGLADPSFSTGFAELSAAGARPIIFSSSGEADNTPAGVFGFKIEIPFC